MKHGREIAHIIAKKRAAKRPQSVDVSVSPAVAVEPAQGPNNPELDALAINLAAAWACFEELEGPHHMWRIEKLIERGMSWKVLGITGPKRTTIQDTIFEDIVRFARSKAKKGKDRYDIVKVWFGADAGLNTKRDVVMSHCTIKNMPTMQARYDWLKWMNGILSDGLLPVLDYYEGVHGTAVVIPKMTGEDAVKENTRRLYVRIQQDFDGYQRTRQPQFRHDLESQAGAGSAVPKGHGGHPTQVTHFKGWERHPNAGLPSKPKQPKKGR
jgi:hypothetical protein